MNIKTGLIILALLGLVGCARVINDVPVEIPDISEAPVVIHNGQETTAEPEQADQSPQDSTPSVAHDYSRGTSPATRPSGQATEEADEPVTEPETEPETEPATEPETEPVTEPATEPVDESATEPAETPTEPSDTAPEQVEEVQPVTEEEEIATTSGGMLARGMEVKLNTLSLPLLVLNAAVEFRPWDHWSVSVPVYYTSLDWFSENRKFRVLAFQPEVRYWLRDDFQGLFFNAHTTFGWYNVAFGGDYRYQDHARRSPAYGGGLGIGYKLRLGQEQSRWGLEFGAGAGVIPLHYDYYYNIHNGRLAGEDKRVYWGPDQAFVSITYSIIQPKRIRK